MKHTDLVTKWVYDLFYNKVYLTADGNKHIPNSCGWQGDHITWSSGMVTWGSLEDDDAGLATFIRMDVTNKRYKFDFSAVQFPADQVKDLEMQQ